MKQSREEAVEKAKADLAARLSADAGDIDVVEVVDTEFSDMSLGAAAGGEMAAQMFTSGWKIRLAAAGRNYEYRADKYQLRLVDFEGQNYLVQ